MNFDTDDWDRVTLSFHAGPAFENPAFQYLDSTGVLRSITPVSVMTQSGLISATFDLPTPALAVSVFKVCANT